AARNALTGSGGPGNSVPMGRPVNDPVPLVRGTPGTVHSGPWSCSPVPNRLDARAPTRLHSGVRAQALLLVGAFDPPVGYEGKISRARPWQPPGEYRYDGWILPTARSMQNCEDKRQTESLQILRRGPRNRDLDLHARLLRDQLVHPAMRNQCVG